MAEPPAARRRRRRRVALLVSLLLLAAIIAGAFAARRDLMGWALERTLGLLGMEHAALVVEDVDLRGLELRDVRLGGAGELEIAKLRARYSLPGLRAGRLDALRLEGLRLRGAVDDEGLSFGALDVWRGGPRATSTGAEASTPVSARFAVLPVDRLELEDARVEVETPEGPAAAALSLDLDDQGEGAFTLTTTELRALESGLALEAEPFALAGRVSLGPERREIELAPAPFQLKLGGEGAVQRVSGVLPVAHLSLAAAAGEPTRLETSGGSLSLPDLELELTDLASELRLEPRGLRPRGSVAIGEIRDTRRPPRFQPLRLQANLEPRDDQLGFDASLAYAAATVSLQARGTFDPGRARANADLELSPITLGPGRTRPADLVPTLGSVLSDATGVLEGRGQVRWEDGALRGRLDLGLRDLSLTAGSTRVECINALLRLDGPWPPRTPAGQLLSMARLDIGLELTDGVLSYRLNDAGVLELASAEWHFAGGRVVTGGTFDPFADEQHLLLAVDDVDLGQLLALANLEGLTGTGRIGGRLPIVWRGDVIEIREGVLAATAEGGWIRYRPSGGAGLANLGVLPLQDLGRALENFRYTALVLRLDGETRGPIVISAQLAGANPGYRDAQPYEFNLNVEGRLGDLLRQGSLAYRIPERIETKLGEAFGKAPPPPPRDPCARNDRSGLLDADGARRYADRSLEQRKGADE